MAKKRKRHSAQFKAKVALEAFRGLQTASELASEYEVHPVTISQWKRKLLDHVPEIFEFGRGAGERRDAAEHEAALYEQIGRLKMELEWLKKKAAQLQ